MTAMTAATRQSPFTRPVALYGALVLFLVAVGGWLVLDFWRERERTMAEVSRLAMHKSQLISALFGDTFIAADYVLHDMADHLDLALARQTALVDLTPLLEKKIVTVPALTNLVLLDEHCKFAAEGRRFNNLRFTKSNQRFCAATNLSPGQSLHIQYMPPEKSANGKPVVLMSRVVASPQGRLQAAAMVVIELDYAQHWIQTFALGADDVQTIVDTDGVVIARNPPLPEAVGKRTAMPPGQLAFDQVNGVITFTAPSPLDYRERIFGLSRLERFPFIAIVGYDKARALEGWQQRAWQFAFGYLALVLLSIALLRAYLRTVAQSHTLHTLATTDALTGIANRRHLFERGEQEATSAIRYAKPLAVLMIDVDLFKRINDRWGHPSGDRVIRNVANVLRGVLRAADAYGRLGGEEFTAVLPETDTQGAIALAERLRLAVEASEVAHTDDGQVIRHTVSIGVATLAAGDATFEDILRRADLALYRAKESGRNQVVAG